MKAKYFRINIVFTAPVTVFWALVYVPEGLPIGQLTDLSISQSAAYSLYEPQQFIIASGVYTSQGADGSTAGPLRVWSPLARNLSPGDGVFLVWRPLTAAQGIGTIFTINYSCCVN